MAGPDDIREVVDRYVKLMNAGDSDGIAALYADDATLEDPVGSEPRSGRAAIRDFYAASAGAVVLELTGPVRVAGHEAAFPMLVTVGAAEPRSCLDVIDVMTFDEAAQIRSMRAFWSQDAIRPAG
jgi:steroid delta-isomerase